MTIKQGSVLILLFSFMNNLGFLDYDITPPKEPKDFVFNQGARTGIKGNHLWQYLRRNRFQVNVVPAFRHIRVIELTKDKEFTERGTLGSLEKENFSMKDKFAKHAMANNAIYCGEVELAKDYDGKLYPIGAIVYRTQDLENCAFVKEYIAQQKAAEAETK